MKLVLTALNAKYVHTNLAVRYLKEYSKNLEYQCLIKEFSINDQLENILEATMEEKPDVIAFSCYIWNIEMVIKLSTLIKKVNKNIEILYGGPEVSYDGKEFLQGVDGDYLIEGEGEEPFRQFVLYKLNRGSIEEIPGLLYKDGQGNIKGKSNFDLLDMNRLPFPYRDELEFKNKIIYYEASRGCPFNCKYCLSSTIRGVRFRELDLVKEELTLLMERGVALVKFVDRTFNANRDYARKLWQYLKEVDSSTCFHFEISADLLTDEDIELLSSVPKGRFQFEIGVQSTNEQVVRNIARTMNLEKLGHRVKELCLANNIHLHLDLIAGLPGESFESFKESFNRVYSFGPHVIQLGFLKLLKGSKMKEEEEQWGMVYSPYPPYEIIRNNDISYEELLILKKVETIVDKYYNSGNFNNILSYLMANFNSAFDFFLSLAKFFQKKGYFNRSISGVEYYRIFIEFYKETIGDDLTVLKDIIKYDYFTINKKSWLPDFLDKNASKEEEKVIKELLINEYNIATTKGIYIQGYSIDINKFISNDIVDYKKCFLVYKNEKVPVKTFYYEEIIPS
jgi:anaerobic magnesium-protoporphyrin IX monomethyl ester cyclase